MNNDLNDVIEQADLLIKEGKFKSAWKLLLPHQDDPAARKRLMWLDQKRQQSLQAEKKPSTMSDSRQRYRLYLLIAVVIILGLGVLVIYGLSQQKPVPPTAAGEPTQIMSVPTAIILVTPTATEIPPTEIPPTESPTEVNMQQQLRDWLASVEGVSQVLSFDVDIPGDEPPLAYVEVTVKPGYNDTHIPDAIVKKLDGVLNTTQYSDFSIIMNDDSRTVEYSFDSKSSSWNQTELAVTPSSSD